MSCHHSVALSIGPVCLYRNPHVFEQVLKPLELKTKFLDSEVKYWLISVSASCPPLRPIFNWLSICSPETYTSRPRFRTLPPEEFTWRKSPSTLRPTSPVRTWAEQSAGECRCVWLGSPVGSSYNHDWFQRSVWAIRQSSGHVPVLVSHIPYTWSTEQPQGEIWWQNYSLTGTPSPRGFIGNDFIVQITSNSSNGRK